MKTEFKKKGPAIALGAAVLAAATSYFAVSNSNFRQTQKNADDVMKRVADDAAISNPYAGAAAILKLNGTKIEVLARAFPAGSVTKEMTMSVTPQGNDRFQLKATLIEDRGDGPEPTDYVLNDYRPPRTTTLKPVPATQP